MPRYLITGATGYIGSMLVKSILQNERNAEIIALTRDSKKINGLFGEKVKLFEIDLCDKASMDSMAVKCDYIFHCASVTKSSEMVIHPVEVTESIVNTTQNILELARRSKAKSMVYLSSMEIYGNIDCSDGRRVSEDELGEIDLLNVRSCYSMGKRMAENICYSYFKEYAVPVKIARLAQTFGRGILPTDSRVFAQFAKSVLNGTDIILRTNGTSMGNYCAIEDAIEGLFTILHKGENGEAYNVVNEENTMRIREMADLVAGQVAGGKIQVRVEVEDIGKNGYAPDTGLRLSGEKLRKLGWRPGKGLIEMYRDVIKEMEIYLE